MFVESEMPYAQQWLRPIAHIGAVKREVNP